MNCEFLVQTREKKEAGKVTMVNYFVVVLRVPIYLVIFRLIQIFRIFNS